MRVNENFGPKDFDRLVDEENATASRLIFTDETIFKMEQEKVFAKAWLYVGHESEILNVGDYVTRQMATDPVILTRGEDGKAHVLHNACSHRGAIVCNKDSGNARGFTCPYHGWVFGLDGSLKATADDQSVYEGKVDFSTLNLKKTARVDSYAGLIFATWNDKAPDLGDYLGDARWYLDMYHNRTPGGMEIIGEPQRWIADANWKLGALNFGADGPHAVKVHGPVTVAAIGVPMSLVRESLTGSPSVSMGNGHNGIISQVPAEYHDQFPPYLGSHPDMVELYKKHLGPEQNQFLSYLLAGVQTMFPNFSSIQSLMAFDPMGMPVSFMNIRVWQPVSPTKTEIWNWFLVDKEAPEDFKRESMLSGIRSFSVGGTFDQDDSEAWSSITRGINGNIGQQGDVNFQMALAFRDKTIPDFPGPGRAYPSNYAEVTEFDVLLEWQKYMRS
ncbi:MAG: Rieske 2Fe-2S domain-containing protein [Immundisolibacteraceae bacterium]|nr:Rieske 2Fe-2S domain-containing protein [Immundisolibacteraceae bacterium]